MTKQELETLKHLKSEANSAKRRLLDLASKIDSVSPRQADQLRTICGRLEDWQHRTR